MSQPMKIAIMILLTMVPSVCLVGQSMKLPSPQKQFVSGAEAVDFTLKDQDGRDVTLAKLRGNPVLLVFYRGYW